jgi:hypothetical protein
MKKALYTFTLVLVFLTLSHFSQAQNKSGNWFIGIGIGANALYDNAHISPASPSAQLYAGKWFTPSFGARIAVQGILARPADPENWFSDNTVFGLNQLHIDGMWNFMNTFTPYKRERVWNPALYLRLNGGLASSLGSHKPISARAAAGLTSSASTTS